ncbi:FixH family protein [Bacillus sp. JJ1764]|uniref:FixH family protein n=1 Tax=Bacillus sp. JJ1764 TaxID=3122964 RepID=UPI002FFE2518
MMKRVMFALLLLAAILTGCSSGPDYTIKVTKDLYYQQDKASPFEIKVTENNKPATGLKVRAELSMASMDHGTTKATLTEGEKGTYSGEVNLSMSGKYEAAFTLEKGGKKTEKVMTVNVTKSKGVAMINGQWITNEDIAFYTLINKLQLEINREAAKKKYSGPQLEEELAYLDSQEKSAENKNQLLTQIIRLRSMALLAEEKGHKATDAEVEQAMHKARDQYNQFESTKALIQNYGEDRFWGIEKQQYKQIVLTQKVQKDLIDKIKKEHPSYGDQEVYYQAQQQYEDLLVSQVNSLKIEIL